jgi:hypothetical protein
MPALSFYRGIYPPISGIGCDRMTGGIAVLQVMSRRIEHDGTGKETGQVIVGSAAPHRVLTSISMSEKRQGLSFPVAVSMSLLQKPQKLSSRY